MASQQRLRRYPAATNQAAATEAASQPNQPASQTAGGTQSGEQAPTTEFQWSVTARAMSSLLLVGCTPATSYCLVYLRSVWTCRAGQAERGQKQDRIRRESTGRRQEVQEAEGRATEGSSPRWAAPPCGTARLPAGHGRDGGHSVPSARHRRPRRARAPARPRCTAIRLLESPHPWSWSCESHGGSPNLPQPLPASPHLQLVQVYPGGRQLVLCVLQGGQQGGGGGLPCGSRAPGEATGTGQGAPVQPPLPRSPARRPSGSRRSRLARCRS